jgi:hypothetical protein
MASYTGKNMPKEVGHTTMDFEVKEWLKDGPVLVGPQGPRRDDLSAVPGYGRETGS